MLQRILAVTKRDLISGFRDSMIVYILIAPMLIALIIRAFIPAVGDSLINIAVPENTQQSFIEMLQEHAKIELLKDRDAVISRVGDTDDLFGIVAENPHDTISSRLEIISGGDEMAGTIGLVEALVGSWQNQHLTAPVEVTITDMGWKLSPLARFGSNFLVVFLSVFGGMIVMLNLVEEKQYRTLAAVNVSPLKRWEYVIGKSLLGIVLPVIHAFAVLLIMGFFQINYLQVAAVTLAIALISLVIGFVIGVYQSEPIGAVSSMKVLFLPILASIFGAIFLEDKWHPLLYWSPFYWAFQSIDSIILKQGVWLDIWRNNLIILGITVLAFLLMRKRISRGMN